MQPHQSVSPESALHAQCGLIAVNGTELYYEDTGESATVSPSRDTIIFSHALLLDTNLFAPQVEVLKKDYRCISYDHRGQGRSAECGDLAISMDLLCDDVVALMDKLQVSSAHFCGLSMGGFVALRLAARYPHRVKSLVLCSTSGDAESFPALLKYTILNFVSFLFGPASVAKAVAPIIYGKTTYSDPSRQQEYLALIERIGGNRRSIWRAVNGVIFRPGVAHELARISVPALVLVGEEDICTTPPKSKRLAQFIPNAQLKVVPRAGHAITLEHPEAVNSFITHFLSEISGR